MEGIRDPEWSLGVSRELLTKDESFPDLTTGGGIGGWRGGGAEEVMTVRTPENVTRDRGQVRDTKKDCPRGN